MLNKILFSNQTSRASDNKPEKIKTVEGLLALMEPTVAKQFNYQQWQEVQRLIKLAVGEPSSKIVNLNFTIDLIISRFYFTLLVGKDIRHQGRKNNSGNRIANLIAAFGLIFALNIIVSVSIIVIIYLIKSALGIDLMPGHGRDAVVDMLSLTGQVLTHIGLALSQPS